MLEEWECDGAKVVDAEGCFVVGDALEADGERLFAKGPAIFGLRIRMGNRLDDAKVEDLREHEEAFEEPADAARFSAVVFKLRAADDHARFVAQFCARVVDFYLASVCDFVQQTQE